MLTSAGYLGDATRCRQLGIAAYLVKPIRQGELLNAICAVLSGRNKFRRDAEIGGRVARATPQIRFTGSMSTVSETSSGKFKLSSNFARDWLSLLICRVRSTSW